jgi:pseudouridine-5'-monophosphatase
LPIAPPLFLEELMSMIIPALGERAEPMPGAVATIAAAKQMGIPIAIASSSPSTLVEPIVRRLGWDVEIPVRCTGDQVTHAKPAPDIFLLAAERLGVAPSDCLVLEDSVNGARAATAAGMTCIAVPNPVYQPSHFEGITAAVIPSLEVLDLHAWLE